MGLTPLSSTTKPPRFSPTSMHTTTKTRYTLSKTFLRKSATTALHASASSAAPSLRPEARIAKMPTTDKARYYLEQSVPQLQELLRKEIFTNQEIKSITKKRSDFEHTINARGHHATDYATYASYEINLASLIAKRSKRLKIKH